MKTTIHKHEKTNTILVCKNLFFTVALLLTVWSSSAQEVENPLHNDLDKLLVDIDTSKIKSGILYERTMQLANLYNFNSSDSLNTANYKYFKQALLELHNASKQQKFCKPNVLENRLKTMNSPQEKELVDIGILNTDFDILSDWGESPYSGVILDTLRKKYVPIPGKQPFYTLHTTVISPLRNAIQGDYAEFRFHNDNFFSYDSEKNIISLVAEFGDGVSRTVIENGLFINSKITVNYTTSGLKIIKFSVKYRDNTEVVTYGSVYFRSMSQPIAESASCNSNDPLRQDFSITSALDFTGYRTTDPTIKPKFDYRVYYSDGNTAKNLMKPILIIDGFDPEDKRKIEDCDCEQDPECANRYKGSNGLFDAEKHKSITDMMVYYENNNVKYLLKELRSNGYDVIIVNFPKYQTTNQQNGQLVDIDGGAYYIESNALALVKLLSQTRQELITNNSPNQVAIIAPSMAGQISRYALSYMEKNNMPHNVYLWVSVDSPHLGANIPLGDQGLIFRLTAFSQAAEEFYNTDLSSPAGQQQLIEFHRPISNGNVSDPLYQNAQTTTQGLSQNRGNSFYQEHYNRQNTNGLPNASGWPQNCRKIAVVNGSLTGSKETQLLNGNPYIPFPSEESLVLNIRGFQRIRLLGTSVGKAHVASLESRFLPKSYNSGIKISRLHRYTHGDRPVFAGNPNPRGCMDNVPGGYYDAQLQLKNSILNTDEFANIDLGDWLNINFLGTSGYWDLREFYPIHSFIPSFSAIAHLNPNQNWNNPLNDNLTCPNNKQTPFDSYFGIAKNTPHTSFTKECVDWLLKELDGIPQLPDYPLKANLLKGAKYICLNSSKEFNFLDACQLPSPVVSWSVTPNLQIQSTTNYTVNVTGIALGLGTITATFANGKTATADVTVANPVFSQFKCKVSSGSSGYGNCHNFLSADPASMPQLNREYRIMALFNNLDLASTIDEDWEWEPINENVVINKVKNIAQIGLLDYGPTGVRVRVRICDDEWSEWEENLFEIRVPDPLLYPAPGTEPMYRIAPNPSTSVLNVSLLNPNKVPLQQNQVITGVLYDMMGVERKTVQIINNQAQVDVSDLTAGLYVIHVFVDNKLETYQVAKQ
jgi:hypothetical protein